MATNNPKTSDSASQLLSDFAGDPEMTELVEYFIAELNDRVAALKCAFETGNRTQLTTLTHQLKGAAGGYGFPSITQSAALLERLLKSDEAEMSTLAEKFESLITLCRRATAA